MMSKTVIRSIVVKLQISDKISHQKKTILENLTSDLNATNIKYVEMGLSFTPDFVSRSWVASCEEFFTKSL